MITLTHTDLNSEPLIFLSFEASTKVMKWFDNKEEPFQEIKEHLFEVEERTINVF